MDENQDKIVFNESKPFDKQVDDVLSGADTASSHLEVLKVTPPLLRMVGVPNLPILMTARHVKTITQENGSDSANYHGLGVELIKKLPELISDPVMIMDSISPDAKAKNSIVIVTQMLDKENRPVIGAIRLAGRGNDLNGFEISANIMTSAYGKDNFQSFIERNIEQGSVLYVDKAKSQVLFETPGIQFPDNFESLDFDIIIRKTNAFVNREEEKKSESTEKNEESMKADTNNQIAQTARERLQQVRDSMVKTLLEHIEKNPTDWQSGWNNIAAGAPYNGKTNTAYRGMNALYLAFLGAKRGYKDTRWVTFNQAKELGASVKKGEKSAPVIFFEFYDRATKKAFDSRTVKDMTEEEKAAYLKENVYAVMKYSSVFNAEQCHNFPERKDVAMSEEERANQNVKIEAIIANSSAPVRYDGGSRAYYSPGTDSIHLPVIQAFDTMQDYYATALHEIAHSTGHESRLNRDLSSGFGSESYAKEELRAELACVFMQMEQGIQLNGKHITNHAAYLNSWLEAAKKDTSVFFKAAADAQKIADYVADNYLQAATVAGTADENVAQEQSEEQPERNPMADYLRTAQPNREAVADAGERTWEQENIRDWYTSAYPNDEAGLDIHPNATFKELREEVNRPNPISVYGMLGEDSVVRERTFTRLAELSGSSYASIYSAFLGETAEQKLENARALAKRLATETGEPYVTIEWSEHQALNSYDVMSLSEADKKLTALDAQEDKNEGYYKTKLHIDYVFEGNHDAYECCRFDIGSEGGGLVHHIDEFLKYDTFLDAEERQQAENALKYFKVHSDLSSMVDTAIASGLSEQEQFDVQSYVLLARGTVNSAIPFSTYKLPDMTEAEQQNEEGNHAEKITLEQARNAMLDAQEQRQNHYAVRIENVPYTDPEDGYEGEEPAQVIYTISKHGTVREWKTIPLDSDVFSSDLPNGSIISYEPVEYEELEEIAQKVREPIQTFKDVLRAELEADTERRRSEAYYDQRVDDILDEHYRTEYGLFERNIENPKYLSGTLYAEENFRGERLISLTQNESGKNIAIISQVNGKYAVAEDYHTDDGRNWGKYHLFDNQESAEEFRTKNFPSIDERTSTASDKSNYVLTFNLNYSNEFLISRALKELGYEKDQSVEANNNELDVKARESNSSLWTNAIVYNGADGKRIEGIYLRESKFGGVMVEATDIVGFTCSNMSEEDAEKIAEIVRGFGAKVNITELKDAGKEDGTDKTDAENKPVVNSQMERRISAYAESLKKIDVELGYAARPEEYYRDRAMKEIAAYEQSDEYKQAVRKDFPKDFIEDSPQDMSHTPQNKPVEAQERKREWLSIELPDGAVGGKYGENTMIKMPKGEFSYYAFYVPTKMLKEADGKTQLRVASDYTFRLNNDGRQVELTGQELKESFAGKHLDKTYKRVAPSRKFAQGLENLQKNIPAELKEIPTWCCYRTRWNDEKGKKDKFIISPIDGKWTSSKEPGKWVTFDAAMKYARENNCEGLSVLLDKKYGITCIDLDKCIEAETGKLNERASKLVEALNGTYIERSTSGNGLHIFVKDDILKGGRYNMTSVDKDKGDLEVYDDKRIMSLTGDMYSKGNTLTRAGSAATVYLRQELGERRNVSNAGSSPRPTGSLTMGDGELVRWIQGSKQGSKFNDLYHGRGVSGNRSDDDAKLAHMLLYFNGGDKDQAFRIMRESSSYRPDKPDSYYRATIDKMDAKIEVYAKRPTFSADGPGKPKGKGPGNGKKGSQA